MDLREQALREGYILTPVSSATRQTLLDVREGQDRASMIAEIRDIARTAASMRLSRLLFLGVVEEDGFEGREKLFKISGLGRRVKWGRPAAGGKT